MKCPNKNCRNYDKDMDNIARLNKDFVNYWCGYCGCHYYGDLNNPKFFTKEKWQDYVNVVDGIDYRKIFPLDLPPECV
jgi:hypothetical protein